MNKIKILLLASIFFLTGCTVDYNLTIDGDIIKEEISAVDYNSNEWDKFNSYGDFSLEDTTYRDLINLYTSRDIIINSTSDNSGIYKKELIDKDGGLGIKLNYDYNLQNFNEQKVAYRCYKYFNVSHNNDVYTISTSKSFMCFNNDYPLLERVNINIKTDYIVKNHNADSQKDNIYTWNITKENAKDKQILLELEIPESKKDSDVFISESNKFLVFVLGILLLILVVVGVYVYLKGNKNNKI